MVNNLNTYVTLSNVGYPTQLEFKQTSIIVPEFTFTREIILPPQYTTPGATTTAVTSRMT